MAQSQLELLVVLTTQISKFFNQISEMCIHTLTRNENKKQIDLENKACSEWEIDNEQNKKQNFQKLDQTIKNENKSNKKGGRKKRIKQKQPGMPKTPASSYLMYFHQNRKQLQAKYGTHALSSITKMAAKDWSELPPEQKQKYTQRSAIQQQNYRKLKAEFKRKAIQQKYSKQPPNINKNEKKGRKKGKQSSSSQKKVEFSSSSSSSSLSSSKSSNQFTKEVKPKNKPQMKNNTRVIQIGSSNSSRQEDSLGQLL